MPKRRFAGFGLLLLLLPVASSAPLTADTCAASSFIQHSCTGPKFPVVHAEPSTSPEECCAACSTFPSCQEWTLNHKEGTCYLKQIPNNPPPLSAGNCTTGVAPPPPPFAPPHPTPKGAKNVLFIVVDDMRPSIGAYNFSLAQTPNMDALARDGLLFQHAYVQYAYCSPSRHSFMTGRRPDTTKVWEFIDHFREEGVGKDWASLPQYFKNHGYITLGSGKLFHPSSATENVGMPNNDWPESWSPEYPYFSNQPPNDPHECANPFVPAEKGTFCQAKVDKDASKLSDQKIRDNCIYHLHVAKNATKKNKPFFVGCGFHKPHVPWVAPEEFYGMYPDYNSIPLAADTFAPIGMPEVAWHEAGDVHGMTESPRFNGTCNETRARLYRRAYYASVSYQDYNIGRVLETLDQLELTDSTIVVVFGDHGWQLGEHDTWAKMTNFEMATHVPLIMRVPWKKQARGKHTAVLAEMVDVYPTLAELAGLPDPKSEGEMLNGTSLAPLFDDPNAISLKTAAFSQFGKQAGGLDGVTNINPRFTRAQTAFMGYTVRVPDWRYTVWFNFDNSTKYGRPDLNEIIGRELYDHHGDTGLWLDFPGENVNLADRDEHAAVVKELHSTVLEYIQLK